MNRLALERIGKAAVLLGRAANNGPAMTWNDKLRYAAALGVAWSSLHGNEARGCRAPVARNVCNEH